jgi:hypothetical protein
LAARARPCAARTRLLGLIYMPNGALRAPPPMAASLLLINENYRNYVPMRPNPRTFFVLSGFIKFFDLFFLLTSFYSSLPFYFFLLISSVLFFYLNSFNYINVYYIREKSLFEEKSPKSNHTHTEQRYIGK